MPALLLDNFLDTTYSDWYSQYHTDELEVFRAPESQFPDPEELARYDHIILSGSEESIVNDRPWIDAEMELVRAALELQIPTLGLCFGHQLIARALLGPEGVRRSPTPEFGWQRVTLTKASAAAPLFTGLPSSFHIYNAHFDEVVAEALATDARFTVLATSEGCAIQAFRVQGAPMWGVQFHPEIGLAEGKRYLRTLPSRYPELEVDVEGLIGEARDDGVAERLFGNFYGV